MTRWTRFDCMCHACNHRGTMSIPHDKWTDSLGAAPCPSCSEPRFIPIEKPSTWFTDIAKAQEAAEAEYKSRFARFQLLISIPLTRVSNFNLQIGILEMVVTIGNLQLGIRHPENTGPGAHAARTICDNLILAMDHFSPGLRNVLFAGYSNPPIQPQAVK